MKNVTLSSVSHSARRSGCTLVENLKPAFSFINTTPAGTEAMIGETILHIPVISNIVSTLIKQMNLTEQTKSLATKFIQEHSPDKARRINMFLKIDGTIFTFKNQNGQRTTDNAEDSR